MYYRGLIQRGDLDINPLMTAMTRCFLGQGMWNLTKNKKTNNTTKTKFYFFFLFFFFFPFSFIPTKIMNLLQLKTKK